MRRFAVRAEIGTVGFSPVRALINTGATATWPRQARIGLKLVAPDDPACATDEEEENGTVRGRAHAPDRVPYGEWVVRSLREVARAWLDQVGPCRVDVIDAELLDDGSRLFFSALAELAELSDGLITVHCPAAGTTGSAVPVGLIGPVGPVGLVGLVPEVASARERRIEYLATSTGRLSGEEADFLYRQALGYLGTGDGWTAERILRAVLRLRPTPAVRAKLRAACALLGRPLNPGHHAPGAEPGPAPEHHPPGRAPGHTPDGAGPAGRGPLRLHSGWERVERWAETAGQIHKNAVHKALFAVADRTVFRTYETYDDATQPLDFFVPVREGLILKIHIRDLDSFEIAHVGSIDEVPGIGREIDRAA
ncbi:DUF6235 family protein [Streptomyces sp. NBC_01433]|uniref:DUF6235 family protein n=1 Tax=Streptomyces sp. NBC_01433 TaxID=2903864 RepID=UPI00225B0C27|nr:DUF6235 family protein [Streptomyces sp. NBC_01433]MCX4679715.1 DUF6235 family protein [Streptomyces sp. NBC_01433]